MIQIEDCVFKLNDTIRLGPYIDSLGSLKGTPDSLKPSNIGVLLSFSPEKTGYKMRI